MEYINLEYDQEWDSPLNFKESRSRIMYIEDKRGAVRYEGNNRWRRYWAVI